MSAKKPLQEPIIEYSVVEEESYVLDHVFDEIFEDIEKNTFNN